MPTGRAKSVGKFAEGEEVAAITESTMRGEIEYDESLRKRVAVLKGLEETALDRIITERLKLSLGAEKMIAGVKKAGLKLLLVSGGLPTSPSACRSASALTTSNRTSWGLKMESSPARSKAGSSMPTASAR